MVLRIEGEWDKGFAFDYHSTQSVYLGMDSEGREQFETTRTEMGELLYQLKYRRDLSSVGKIVDLLSKDIKGFDKINAIVPCPASNPRENQPVLLIANALGARFNIPVISALKKEQHQEQAKDIGDPAERQKSLLASVKASGAHDFSDKLVLLLDDLYQTGSTLTAATRVLRKDLNARRIVALTLTKTRG